MCRRESAHIGVCVTFEEAPRELEATHAGFYTSPIGGRDYPRIQILTTREMLADGNELMLPLLILSPYQQAERMPANQAAVEQERFGG